MIRRDGSHATLTQVYSIFNRLEEKIVLNLLNFLFFDVIFKEKSQKKPAVKIVFIHIPNGLSNTSKVKTNSVQKCQIYNEMIHVESGCDINSFIELCRFAHKHLFLSAFLVLLFCFHLCIFLSLNFFLLAQMCFIRSM